MSSVSQQQVQDITNQINSIATWMDDFASSLEALCDEDSNPAQKIVDDLADDYLQPLIDEKFQLLETAVNNKLAEIREQIIVLFRSQYQSAQDYMDVLQPLVDALSLNPSSIAAVWNVVKEVLEYLTGPYGKMAASLADIVQAALSLSSALVNVASHIPSISIPDVTIPTLNIHVDPITAQDITGGNS